MAMTGDHLVEIQGFKFHPDKLRVRAGDRITWSNRDIAPHTATAKDESWDTGEIRKDQARSLRVTPDMSGDLLLPVPSSDDGQSLGRSSTTESHAGRLP